jgi:CBS domain-containing protein
MTTVRQVLQSKGNQVWSISPQSSVYQALELMAAKDIGAVLVVNEFGQLSGIFSERDYARKVILKGRASKTVTVGELMTSKVIVVPPDTTLQECLQIMTEHKIRHLPVVEEGNLVGVITIGDVGKSLISQHEFTIKELEKYITGPAYPGESNG